MYKYIILYFVMINIVGCVINIIDKRRAKKEQWRIKESTLWLIALLGGATGEYLTMKAIRHKTKHTSFMIGMPLLSLISFALLYYFITLTLPK